MLKTRGQLILEASKSCKKIDAKTSIDFILTQGVIPEFNEVSKQKINAWGKKDSFLDNKQLNNQLQNQYEAGLGLHIKPGDCPPDDSVSTKSAVDQSAGSGGGAVRELTRRTLFTHDPYGAPQAIGYGSFANPVTIYLNRELEFQNASGPGATIRFLRQGGRDGYPRGCWLQFGMGVSIIDISNTRPRGSKIVQLNENEKVAIQVESAEVTYGGWIQLILPRNDDFCTISTSETMKIRSN